MSSSGPPWLAITLAVLALLGVVATAAGPVLVERTRGRGDPPPAIEPGAEAPSAHSALAFVEDTLRDLRSQRDLAQARVEALLSELDREQERTADLRLRLARYEGGTYAGPPAGQ